LIEHKRVKCLHICGEQSDLSCVINLTSIWYSLILMKFASQCYSTLYYSLPDMRMKAKQKGI